MQCNREALLPEARCRDTKESPHSRKEVTKESQPTFILTGVPMPALRLLALNTQKINMKLLFLDCETTGLDEEDRLCQVAYQPEGHPPLDEFFKPPVPIKVGAMAVSHITNKMVEDAPAFIGSDMEKTLKLFAEEGWVLVAHNAPFDLKMLAKEGIVFDKYIDTKKMSHALDLDMDMESHRLQYLRYFYGIELVNAVAHSAEGDVAVLIAVYKKLHELLGSPSIEEMVALSARPVLFTKFKFGKYNGNYIANVASVNPGYLEWMLDQKKQSGEAGEADWIYTLEHYLANV